MTTTSPIISNRPAGATEAQMTIKHWDDRELAKVSADLDAELEQLFDEMETVLNSPGEEEAKPQLEFLPDDDEGNKAPPKARRLRPEKHLPVSAAAEEDLQGDDFEAITAAISPAEERTEPAPQPCGRKISVSFRSAQQEHELPEAEVLPDDSDEDIQPSQPETIADLSPDEFSRLMERAVARGVLAALRKWQKPLR